MRRPGMDIQKAIVLNEKDNVATLLADVDTNSMVQVTVGGSMTEFRMQGEIRFGHKFATRKINKGESVIKYGEPIGRATQDIEEGQHVHVHNVESLRARGDLL
jgi:altronate dehydratase small subunit